MTTCVVKGCLVEREGSIAFHGEFCLPCYEFITQGRQNHSTAYRNSLIPIWKGFLQYLHGLEDMTLNTSSHRWYHWFSEGEDAPSEVLRRTRKLQDSSHGGT